MNRRLMCILLTALMLFGMIPAMAVPALAGSDMTTSDACVEILKEMEGFLEFAVYDNGQYTIGYGSGCGRDEYPNGITEEQAEELLWRYLNNMQKDINLFIDRYQLKLNQHQFDALMLFSYNCGTNWVGSDGEFRSAIISGATGNELLYPFCLWSNAGGELNMGLVNRRLIEADLYLNGNYSNSKPSHYTYVVFDHNEGISDVRVQGYDSNLTDLVRPTPTMEGSRFLGWYTTTQGGSWITRLNNQHNGITLYAHWQEGEGDAVNGTPASYQRAVSQLAVNNIYDAPGGSVTGTLGESEQANIVADYVDSSNMKWGKLDRGGWVILGSPLTGTDSLGSNQSAVKVTVTRDGVNIRSGPGTTYGIVGSANTGDQMEITDTRKVGDLLWGKFTKGWIALKYTDYEEVTGDTGEYPDEPNEPETVIAIATVAVDLLNIRSGPGEAFGTVGCLKRGDRVEITRKQLADGTTWGKMSKGWISLAYVTLEKVEEPEETTPPTEPEETTPPTEPEETTPPTEPEETTPPTEPEETTPPTEPEETTPPTEPDEETGLPGKVNSPNGLNIRSGPGIHNKIVGHYKHNTRVVILEQIIHNGVTWGRTDLGWVSMQYIKLDIVGGADGDDEGVLGTVVTQTGLNIRSGPGAHYPVVASYHSGTRIRILEQRKVGDTYWGRTELGWVSMQYVKLDTPSPVLPDVPQDTTGIPCVVTAQSGLNIRSGPGTGYPVVGNYRSGDRIMILEQKLVETIAWGRTDKGWISMQYVKLDTSGYPDQPDETPGTPGGTTGGINGTVISNSPLNIRSGPGIHNPQIGAYRRGTRVTILEQIMVGGLTWGRTELGWVSMQYVLLDVDANTTYYATVTASSLAIRDGAGVKDTNVVGYYKRGDVVKILETTYVQGAPWGRTDKGWICLAYVQK